MEKRKTFDAEAVKESYAGGITTNEAELLLAGKPIGTFLCRDSSQGPSYMTISCVVPVKGKPGTDHSRVKVEGGSDRFSQMYSYLSA